MPCVTVALDVLSEIIWDAIFQSSSSGSVNYIWRVDSHDFFTGNIVAPDPIPTGWTIWCGTENFREVDVQMKPTKEFSCQKCGLSEFSDWVWSKLEWFIGWDMVQPLCPEEVFMSTQWHQTFSHFIWYICKSSEGIPLSEELRAWSCFTAFVLIPTGVKDPTVTD